MRLGFIGAGNMAAALARGLGEPVLASDAGSGRAAALARELGGDAATTEQVAEQADVVVLCHKPKQLRTVAAAVAPHARAVASVLAGVPLQELRDAYPGTPVVRVMPNVPVEVRAGVIAVSAEQAQERELADRLRPQLERLGLVVDVPEDLMPVVTATMSCATAYVALVVEAQVDAAVRRGVPAPLATRLVVENMRGTAELLADPDRDTLAVRRAVASPGGSTARGLAALERGGIRAAFSDAMDAVVGP